MHTGLSTNTKVILARFNKIYPLYVQSAGWVNNAYYPLHLDQKVFEIKFIVSANLASCWGSEIVHYDLQKETLTNAVSVLIKSISKNVDSFDLDSLVLLIKKSLIRGETTKEPGGDYYGSWSKYQLFSIDLDTAISIIQDFYARENFF